MKQLYDSSKIHINRIITRLPVRFISIQITTKFFENDENNTNRSADKKFCIVEKLEQLKNNDLLSKFNFNSIEYYHHKKGNNYQTTISVTSKEEKYPQLRAI